MSFDDIIIMLVENVDKMLLRGIDNLKLNLQQVIGILWLLIPLQEFI